MSSLYYSFQHLSQYEIGIISHGSKVDHKFGGVEWPNGTEYLYRLD